ncbi:OmpA family protein [Parvibaculum sp.]|jgi:outer membrane protein OmpA-like peptidoglycan-associated protein|uniref:OmpA family protein n=1 Tax=Parvibaculum sp. TaxID=2024848 RepID=UPI002FDA1481
MNFAAVRILCLAAILAAPVATGYAADVEGVQEHPMIERYPGQDIRWQKIENHMPYKVPAGPVSGYRAVGEVIETAGRVTRTFYVYEGADRTHTEIWKNYSDALKEAGFEIIGEGAPTTRPGRSEIGGRAWLEAAFGMNPWSAQGEPVNMMTAGTSTQGDSAAIVAKKDRAAGTAYVVVTVEQHSADTVASLIDIVEVEAAETGLVSVDAEAIGKGIAEKGRVVLDGVVFEFDKATLKPESQETLSAIASYLAANPDLDFYVVGHTDQVGTFAYNQNLSADRAAAVVEALTRDHGVASGRLEPHGVGPLSPVYSNGTDAGREQNRRVELVER